MQEAVVVGLDKAGTKEDQIITAYRDHGHAVCRGSESKAVLAELLGKFTGVSKGKGGSMHMYSGTVANSIQMLAYICVQHLGTFMAVMVLLVRKYQLVLGLPSPKSI